MTGESASAGKACVAAAVLRENRRGKHEQGDYSPHHHGVILLPFLISPPGRFQLRLSP